MPGAGIIANGPRTEPAREPSPGRPAADDRIVGYPATDRPRVRGRPRARDSIAGAAAAAEAAAEADRRGPMAPATRPPAIRPAPPPTRRPAGRRRRRRRRPGDTPPATAPPGHATARHAPGRRASRLPGPARRHDRGRVGRLAQAHVELAKAELSEIMEHVQRVAALFGAAIGLVLYAVLLVVIGTSLFLGEWLFGSIGWGVLLFTELALSVALVGRPHRHRRAPGADRAVPCSGRRSWVSSSRSSPGSTSSTGSGRRSGPGSCRASIRPTWPCVDGPHRGRPRRASLVGLVVGVRSSGETPVGETVGRALGAGLIGGLLGAAAGAFSAITFSPQVAVALGIATLLADWAVAVRPRGPSEPTSTWRPGAASSIPPSRSRPRRRPWSGCANGRRSGRSPSLARRARRRARRSPGRHPRGGRHPGQGPAFAGQVGRDGRWSGLLPAGWPAPGRRRCPSPACSAGPTRSRRRCCPRRSSRPSASWARTAIRVRGRLEREFARYLEATGGEPAQAEPGRCRRRRAARTSSA